MTHTKSLIPALLAATLLLGTAHIASAQSASAMRPTTVPGSSYIAFAGGPSDFSRVNAGQGGFSRDDSSTAYSLSAGNYAYNQNVGVEIGYTRFGDVARGGGTSKAEGINLSLVGRLPLNPLFNLLGKVGTTYGHTEVSAHPLSGLATGSESGFDWSYGVGAEMVITPQWSAVLSYDEAFMKFAGRSSERVSNTMLGLRMSF
jgi:OOP family OmpA-OmpF porin